MKRGTVLAIAALVLACAPVAAWLLARQLAPPLPVLDTLGGDFTLQDTAGRQRALRDFRGQVLLLNFGFTSCPDVCPTVLVRMRGLRRALGAAGAAVQPLFVTIDPARDTPDRLAPYLAHFDPDLVGLLGAEHEVLSVAALFKVYIERTPLPAPLDYGFDHSDQIYLIDSHGRVRATFGSSMREAEMAATVRRLIEEPLDEEPAG